MKDSSSSDANFTYVVAGVSNENEPMVASVWHSNLDRTEEIKEFLSKQIDTKIYGNKEALAQMHSIYNVIPHYTSKEPYPVLDRPGKVLVDLIEEQTKVTVDKKYTNVWIEDLDRLYVFSVGQNADRVFLLRKHAQALEEGQLMWRTCNLRINWEYF